MQDEISDMHTVKVKRKTLLATVQENRAKHRDTFLDAQAGYRDDMIVLLDTMLEDTRQGKKILRAVSIPEPTDHTEDYDRAIKMLEMCVDDHLYIDSSMFNHLVMDDWGWKREWEATTSNYSNKSR